MKNRWLKNRWSNVLLAGATSAALLGGCAEDTQKPDGDTDGPVATTEFALQPAQSCDDVKDNLVDAMTEELLRQRYDYGGWLEADAAGNNGAPTQGGDRGSNEDSPDDYTTTNNQEAGVDEADFVKTDGDFIYLLNGYDLVIVDSWPAEQAHEVGRFAIGGDNYDGVGEQRDYQYSHPSAMFLDGDHVAIFSQVYESNESPTGEYDYFQGTRITILDVSDRTQPRLDRAIDIEGWYNDARMINGEVYVVSNGWIEYPDGFWDLTYDDGQNTNGLPPVEWDADEARREDLKNQARPIARQLVANLFGTGSITDRLPVERQLNSSLEVVSERTLYSCTDLYMPQAVGQAGILNISHFDLDQKSPIKSTGLLSNGWEVYSSQDNLYVAQSSGWWWWGWGSNDIETAIHKFGLNGPNGQPAYVASGLVDGWLLNQFSMSEHNGYLRVATTDNEWGENPTTGEWEQSGGNHVIVLEQKNGILQETGSIRDLATGEQVFAARFMGDKGYVVTFEQTDPLFTFDLSDPYAPKLLGELKINGFSSYIHPMGPNHLLTIGQDATADGQVLGVHLQIFDVTDMTNPVRTHQEKISTGSWSSWSEAMWDHHAFTYHPGKEILAVPVNIHEWDDQNGQNFSGLLVYKASSSTGFSELGRINHADLVSTYHCGYSSVDCYEYDWWTSVRRSIFIEDYVFSISDMGMKVNDLLTPSVEHTSMVLRQE